ncbi:hypothetical protein Xmau_00304 [Xenorhabdus mauleonii]|uniref:Uncharacterized conserved protein YfdQ, DUF2303 family n=1 Tax=Xenorhabdus mauleonii TaxID=351675 RepID=A0A1I3U3W7_9GAMM|nr:DUF2303 family protein [Xenorhabdus mauleonii]PHM45913.1 hypothetical protein Xmau_00304 [Xenorhabdus mauleonii]SFJ78248.1 Uncharacterized conserved protein YfdQ, DUF2303 family [Xenorhabdus mauleonii]
MSQLDSTAISQIQEMSIAASSLDVIKSANFPAALISENYRIESLEEFELLRYRFRGEMKTTSIDDFVKYSIGYSGEGTRCFIDAEKMRAESIFNLGTLSRPDHADNTASVTLKKTAPFRSLLDINARKQRQKDLAEWLEDWHEHLTAFDSDGNVLDIKKAVAAIRRITIEATQSQDHEEHDFSGKRSVLESVEAKSKEVMPAVFEFKCVPYDGLSERRFKLRYSILTGDNVPVLILRIVQLEAKEEAIAGEFRDLLTIEFQDANIETFIGNFSIR